MNTPKIIVHPVMGWYVISLLFLIVTVPIVYFVFSYNAAWIVSYAGLAIILLAGIVAMLRDRAQRTRGR